MKKRILILFILFTLMFIHKVNADNNEATVNEGTYSFMNAIEQVKTNGGTIILQKSITLTAVLDISVNKPITIDLNGQEITSSQDITFIARKGEVKITGEGAIKNLKQNSRYGTIYVKGSNNQDDADYTHLIIDKNVKVEGPNPLVIDSYDASNYHCYGAVVDIYGQLTNNLSGYASPTVISVDSKLKDTHNAPVINIHDGASIKNDITTGGVGILLSGYANIKADKATIEAHTGIYATAGTINLKGTTISATGTVDYKEENQSKFGKGTGATGAAIQVESKNTTAGSIDININGGNYTSKNNSAIVEYLYETDKTSVQKINISKGRFVSADSKNVINVSEDFKQENKNFISGGNFLSGTMKSDVSEYIKAGYIEDEKGNIIKTSSFKPSNKDLENNKEESANDKVNSNENNYIIAPETEKENNIENPATGEKIYSYLIALIISIIGMGISLKNLVSNNM